MENSKIAELFDIVGSEYDGNDNVFKDHYKQMAIVCSSCFKDEEITGKRVLDAGCGTGTASIYFAGRNACEVVGIDISGKSLEVGLRQKEALKMKNVTFQKGDISKLSFENGRFDVIFSCGAIPYLPDIKGVIDEFIRVTNKGGTIVLFLVKSGRLDRLYEGCRSILSKCPPKYFKMTANILSAAILPFAGFFLKREVGMHTGKPLSQTILESLFSPVGLNKVDPRDICDHFMKSGFRVEEISGIKGVDFYSSETIFICKARRI